MNYPEIYYLIEVLILQASSSKEWMNYFSTVFFSAY